MINLQELRIGNFVSENNEKRCNSEFKKIPFQLRLENFIYDDVRYFDYIELTPTLLERFGFNENGNLDFNGLTPIFSLYIDGDNNIIYNKSLSSFIKIKYVHQLQNIFYSLTGIELIDIVAYNYYLKLHKELTSFDGSLSFEKFMLIIKNRQDFKFGLKSTSICEKDKNYNLGDLPKNLF